MMILIPRCFLLIVLLMFSLHFACAEGAENKNSEYEGNKTKAIMAVYHAIRHHHLTSLKDPCLAYDYDDAKDSDYYIVSVRENRRHPQCGGDPDTTVNLFRFKISKANYTLYTDAGTTDGSYHPLKR